MFLQLLIFTSSHFHIFFTPSHLHTFSSSSHLPIFTPSHLRNFSSSHLLIFTSSPSVDAAIALRSADTELQRAIELQRSTVEHIPWMPQFQCTKHLNTLTCKTQWYSIHKEKKSHLEPSVELARSARQTRRQNDDARDSRASEPIFLRSQTSVYPK